MFASDVDTLMGMVSPPMKKREAWSLLSREGRDCSLDMFYKWTNGRNAPPTWIVVRLEWLISLELEFWEADCTQQTRGPKTRVFKALWRLMDDR